MSSMAAGKKKEASRFFVWLFFILYLIVLFYFLFFAEGMGRLHTDSEYRYNLTLFREIKRFYVYHEILGWRAFFLNVFGNVLIFMPFGYFIPLLMKQKKNVFFTTLFSFELSLCVEIIQLFFKLGSFDVDDIFLNTIGGFLGYLLFYFLGGRRKRNVS